MSSPRTPQRKVDNLKAVSPNWELVSSAEENPAASATPNELFGSFLEVNLTPRKKTPSTQKNESGPNTPGQTTPQSILVTPYGTPQPKVPAAPKKPFPLERQQGKSSILLTEELSEDKSTLTLNVTVSPPPNTPTAPSIRAAVKGRVDEAELVEKAARAEPRGSQESRLSPKHRLNEQPNSPSCCSSLLDWLCNQEQEKSAEYKM